MKEINRRQFLKTAGIGLAGSLLFPYSAFARQSYKTRNFHNDSDEVILARMIFGESRDLFKLNKDNLEPAMIGLTAINRVKKKLRGNNLKQVILAPKQYSCFNHKNPNLKKLKNPLKYDPESWKESLTTSRRILEGKLNHLNYDQTHYHAKDMKRYPRWTKSPRMEKIWVPNFFEHYFYEDIKA